MEHLLKNVPFTLQTLNLEGCDLDDRDLRFLARSHHKVQDYQLLMPNDPPILTLYIISGDSDRVELGGSRPGREIRRALEADISDSQGKPDILHFMMNISTSELIFQLASLELCIEGYDRYRDNTAINEYQAAELISAICKHHMHTIK